MLLPRNAPAWLDRLSTWLTSFEPCFDHVAQRGAFRRYLLGLLSDSRRKSMSAMLQRVHDPGTYQAFSISSLMRRGCNRDTNRTLDRDQAHSQPFTNPARRSPVTM